VGRYRVTAPAGGYSGVSVGVPFRDGVALVDSSEHGAALAYFRRRGYRVEPEAPAEPEQPAKAPTRARRGAAKSSPSSEE